jgi:hypothetical protein
MLENWRWIDVVKLSVMLQPDMKIPAPALAERLGIGAWGKGVVEWLVPPKG